VYLHTPQNVPAVNALCVDAEPEGRLLVADVVKQREPQSKGARLRAGERQRHVFVDLAGKPGGGIAVAGPADVDRRVFLVQKCQGHDTGHIDGRGTAGQWIKEGKYAIKWTRLSCRDFKDNQVRLQLFALAYNLGNFLRWLALPRSVRHWSLTTLREKLIKIGAKVVRHAKYVTLQLAELAVPRELFAAILDRIQRFGVPLPLVQRG
jgi:hypothetical protein